MQTQEELVAEIRSWSPSYFLGMASPGETCLWQDETSFRLDTFIRWISPRHRRLLETPLEISLLEARTVGGAGQADVAARSFGSISLRKGRQAAFAYLPVGSIGTVWQMLSDPQTMIHIGFDATKQGRGHMCSLHIASRTEIEQMLGEPLIQRLTEDTAATR